jgi:hypothetical protein
LSYYIYGFGFPLSFIYCLHFQIGLAILHDQINTVILINHLVKLDNVRVVSIFEDVNLVFKCSFEVRDKILVSLFGIGNFYLLDGIGKAAIDFSEWATRNNLAYSIFVVANSLRHNRTRWFSKNIIINLAEQIVRFG